MPSKSKSQQRLFGMARAEQKGKDTGSAAAKRLSTTMSEGDVRDFAKTKHKDLPMTTKQAELTKIANLVTNYLMLKQAGVVIGGASKGTTQPATKGEPSLQPAPTPARQTDKVQSNRGAAAPSSSGLQGIVQSLRNRGRRET